MYVVYGDYDVPQIQEDFIFKIVARVVFIRSTGAIYSPNVVWMGGPSYYVN